MPPSPAMRCSPGRGDNRNHKRGRSLEGGVLLREKEDDLALFNEMQIRERDNFLIKSNDDFEDLFSTKLRYFPDYKLGISIPPRGESSDLLNADGEKNDYDWLLTPPDTPLFPSLDDETPPVTLPQRGRPRSQPITISRSSTMEKSHRSSRGSPSPSRLSLSPRSGNGTFQSRGGPSSASHSSPTSSLRNAAPTRRPSTPPSKPSTPAPRSSTPTPRRISTGSGSAVSLSGVRGTSPVNTSRGNSASPKIRAWQKNIPGLSLDTPPNLRTSLADRPVSSMRGSSPASRNGGNLSSRSHRNSLSPNASRSVSSSYIHDRDRFSSHGKGSVASSGDDVDSLQSVPLSSFNKSSSKRVGSFPTKRAPAFSKKPTRTGLSSSAPKRSFDLALQQTDHHKGPQSMFRPLLSSVPSSTFFVGKGSAAHRGLLSRNSSITTSSNASSDQGTIGAHDTEGSDQNQDDIECGKAPYTDIQDDVFVFEKSDAANEDIVPGVHDRSPDDQHEDFIGDVRVDSQHDDSDNVDSHSTTMAITETSEVLEVKCNSPEVDIDDMVLCLKCGCRYHAVVLAEEDLKLCPDCRRSVEPLTSASPGPTIVVSNNFPSPLMKISYNPAPFDAMEPSIFIPESLDVTNMDGAAQHEESAQEDWTSSAEPSKNMSFEKIIAHKLTEEDVQMFVKHQVIGQQTVGYNPSNDDTEDRKRKHLSDYPNLKLDVSEGAGISILLKSSSISKGPVVQGRTFTASSITYTDLSYVRDGTSSMRNSLGQISASASSSVDLGSARQAETHVQRQLSGRKPDIENYRYEINTKHQRTGSSLSGTSSHAFQGLDLARSTNEENFEVDGACVENEVVDVTNAASEEQFMVSESARLENASSEVVCNNHNTTLVASTSELSTRTINIYPGDSSVASSSNVEDSASNGNSDFQNDVRSISDQEASSKIPEPSDNTPNPVVDGMGISDVPSHSSLDTISEIEIEKGQLDLSGSDSDVGSPNTRRTTKELTEHSVAATSDKEITASVAEPDTSDHAHSILEESTVKVEGHTRSLTLDEATDAILFCSSIIQNLAYEAAIIAMEKENPTPREGSRPMVTILGNSNSDSKDPRSRTAAKRASKPQKLRQRRAETEAETKPPSGNTASDEKADVSTTTRIVGVPSKGENMKPPTKLESKCNCTVM